MLEFSNILVGLAAVIVFLSWSCFVGWLIGVVCLQERGDIIEWTVKGAFITLLVGMVAFLVLVVLEMIGGTIIMEYKNG